MVNDGLSDKVLRKFFKLFSPGSGYEDSIGIPLSLNGEVHDLIEKVVELFGRPPIEARLKADTLHENTLELCFEDGELGFELLDDSVATPLINAQPAHHHFKDGALKIAGELIGRRRGIVKIGEASLENFLRHANVKTVVNPIRGVLRHGFKTLAG
jgi:hypothetical protein